MKEEQDIEIDEATRQRLLTNHSTNEASTHDGTCGTTQSVECKYSWIVLANVYIGLVVTYGLMSTVGVFHVIFLDEMQESNAMTSWIGSINSSTTMISSWFCSLLLRRFSARAMVMTGVVLCATGLVCSSLANSVIQLIFSFGLLTGGGVGVTYMALGECMNLWFDKRLPVATGIGSSALGMSSFVYPPIIHHLTQIYLWRGAFLILAAIVLQYLVLACFTKPPNPKQRQKLDLKEVLRTELFKSKTFVCFLIAEFGFHCGFNIVQVHLENYAKTQESDGLSVHSRWAIPVYGIVNALSRLLFGLVGNSSRIDAQTLMVTFVSLGGVSLLLMPSMPNGIGLLCCSAAFGFCMGVIGYATYVIVVNYFNRDCMASAFGYVCLSNGIGFLIGAPLAGFIYDVTSEYAYCLYIGGALHILPWLPLVSIAAKRRMSKLKLDFESHGQVENDQDQRV